MDQLPARQDTPFQALEEEKAEVEIDLLGLFAHLAEHWKLFLICLLAGALLMAGCTVFLMEPQYEAVSKMYVLGSGDSVVKLADMQLGTYLASDYQEVFYTHEVTGSVIGKLDLSYTYEQMQEMLRIVNPSGTRVLHIRVTNPVPALAADISNEYLLAAGQYIADVMMMPRPTTLSTALIPEQPVSPSLAMNMVLGAMAGFVLACAYLVIRFMLGEKKGLR